MLFKQKLKRSLFYFHAELPFIVNFLKIQMNIIYLWSLERDTQNKLIEPVRLTEPINSFWSLLLVR